jgi:hypothetical protein
MSALPPDAGGAAGSSATLEELVIADDPRSWSALGFTVSDDSVLLGTVRVRLAGKGAGRGMIGWTLRAIETTELDGLPTISSHTPPPEPATVHPNGVAAIDHVVVMTPALDRTVAALRSAGLDLRRIREEPTPAGAPRQAFFRLGQEILEVVQEPDAVLERAGRGNRPARLWGLALGVEDLDRAAELMGEHLGDRRPAVQAGRTIVTVRRSAGLAVPLALMSLSDAERVRLTAADAPPSDRKDAAS